MKRIFLLTVSLLFIGVGVVRADKDYVITKSELPVKAREFVDKYFAKSKISYVKEERDFFERNYQVFFADGSKVEFYRNGEWREVDCRYTEVPAVIVPSAILNYVREHFAGEIILKIERERSDYDVKISNKLELTFDKNFKIKEIDD